MTFGADPGGESPAEIGACPSTVFWLPIASENWFLFSSELAKPGAFDAASLLA